MLELDVYGTLVAASAVLLALKPGARIVAPHDMYWSLRNWMIGFAANWQITLDFYADADELAALLQRPADLVWAETPANPTWEITDIAHAAELAHAAGARLVVEPLLRPACALVLPSRLPPWLCALPLLRVAAPPPLGVWPRPHGGRYRFARQTKW